jgi:hypothetical protein
MFPTLSFAQLNDDGKTFEKTPSKQNIYARANSILLSGSLSTGFLKGNPYKLEINNNKNITPGIKYQYCRSFGDYVSFKSHFTKRDSLSGRSFTMLTLGVAKSLSQKVNIYLGGGVNFLSYQDERVHSRNGVLEAGCIIKLGLFAIDLGCAYSDPIFFPTLGIGCNF